MSERRPFPPSPRRLALARQSGLTAASPLIGGSLACGAAIVAIVMLARAAAHQLGAWIASACDRSTHANPLVLDRAPGAIVGLALPILGAAAIAATLAHVAQTRALWLPRRRIPGAPGVPRPGVARAAFELASAAVIGGVAFGWLWLTAPRLAVLLDMPSMASGVGAALASLVIALAIAWLVLGVFDALIRQTQLVGALAMTAQEKREDDRLAAADPRWARQRRSLMREPSVGPAVARAAVVLLGDDAAVAIAFDPTREPVPTRTATGRRARATQLVALARRHRVAVHRDVELAAALVGAEGPVPEAHWARLADIVGAVCDR